MPVITVHGVPVDSAFSELCDFYKDLKRSVESVPSLELNQKQVSIFFPKELLCEGLYNIGDEIIVSVSGLFKKPNRTTAVINEYAKNLGKIAKKYFPDSLIEVFIVPFDPEIGFWSSANE